ncbi:CvpA family protein [Amphibacillus jilinensis]|uniref:CvpA family protein n=1 Tax=Amphibacillus jilinensis TaxID=1216008 RepID=UPI0002E92F5D|nr:CvpA family protein [Amphibacillus jilinensis]
MLDIIIFALLVFGIFRGLKRGLILQVFHFISFFVAFTVAVIFYGRLAGHLEMLIPYPRIAAEEWAFFQDVLSLENAYYNMIAFAILFFGTKIILSIIASMLDSIASLPILSAFNNLLGAVFGFVEQYLVLFVLLYIASLLPVSQIQSLLEGSRLASLMINHTPILSEQIQSLWFEHIVNG